MISGLMGKEDRRTRNSFYFPADSADDSFIIAVSVLGNRNSVLVGFTRKSDVEIAEEGAVGKDLGLLVRVDMTAKQEIKRFGVISPRQTVSKNEIRRS